MSRAWAKGSTTAWRKVRAIVLARDHYVCKLKVAGVCTTKATHVHHTIAREIAGDDPKHLLASCEACNLHVGDPRRHDPPPRVNAWWTTNA